MNKSVRKQRRFGFMTGVAAVVMSVMLVFGVLVVADVFIPETPQGVEQEGCPERVAEYVRAQSSPMDGSNIHGWQTPMWHSPATGGADMFGQPLNGLARRADFPTGGENPPHHYLSLGVGNTSPGSSNQNDNMDVRPQIQFASIENNMAMVPGWGDVNQPQNPPTTSDWPNWPGDGGTSPINLDGYRWHLPVFTHVTGGQGDLNWMPEHYRDIRTFNGQGILAQVRFTGDLLWAMQNGLVSNIEVFVHAGFQANRWANLFVGNDNFQQFLDFHSIGMETNPFNRNIRPARLGGVEGEYTNTARSGRSGDNGRYRMRHFRPDAAALNTIMNDGGLNVRISSHITDTNNQFRVAAALFQLFVRVTYNNIDYNSSVPFNISGEGQVVRAAGVNSHTSPQFNIPMNQTDNVVTPRIIGGSNILAIRELFVRMRAGEWAFTSTADLNSFFSHVSTGQGAALQVKRQSRTPVNPFIASPGNIAVHFQRVPLHARGPEGINELTGLTYTARPPNDPGFLGDVVPVLTGLENARRYQFESINVAPPWAEPEFEAMVVGPTILPVPASQPIDVWRNQWFGAVIANTPTLQSVRYEGVGVTVFPSSTVRPTRAGTYRMTANIFSGAAYEGDAYTLIGRVSTYFEIVPRQVTPNGVPTMSPDFLTAMPGRNLGAWSIPSFDCNYGRWEWFSLHEPVAFSVGGGPTDMMNTHRNFTAVFRFHEEVLAGAATGRVNMVMAEGSSQSAQVAVQVGYNPLTPRSSHIGMPGESVNRWRLETDMPSDLGVWRWVEPGAIPALGGAPLAAVFTLTGAWVGQYRIFAPDLGRFSGPLAASPACLENDIPAFPSLTMAARPSVLVRAGVARHVSAPTLIQGADDTFFPHGTPLSQWTLVTHANDQEFGRWVWADPNYIPLVRRADGSLPSGYAFPAGYLVVFEFFDAYTRSPGSTRPLDNVAVPERDINDAAAFNHIENVRWYGEMILIPRVFYLHTPVAGEIVDDIFWLQADSRDLSNWVLAQEPDDDRIGDWIWLGTNPNLPQDPTTIFPTLGHTGFYARFVIREEFRDYFWTAERWQAEGHGGITIVNPMQVRLQPRVGTFVSPAELPQLGIPRTNAGGEPNRARLFFSINAEDLSVFPLTETVGVYGIWEWEFGNHVPTIPGGYHSVVYAMRPEHQVFRILRYDYYVMHGLEFPADAWENGVVGSQLTWQFTGRYNFTPRFVDVHNPQAHIGSIEVNFNPQWQIDNPTVPIAQAPLSAWIITDNDPRGSWEWVTPDVIPVRGADGFATQDFEMRFRFYGFLPTQNPDLAGSDARVDSIRYAFVLDEEMWWEMFRHTVTRTDQYFVSPRLWTEMYTPAGPTVVEAYLEHGSALSSWTLECNSEIGSWQWVNGGVIPQRGYSVHTAEFVLNAPYHGNVYVYDGVRGFAVRAVVFVTPEFRPVIADDFYLMAEATPHIDEWVLRADGQPGTTGFNNIGASDSFGFWEWAPRILDLSTIPDLDNMLRSAGRYLVEARFVLYEYSGFDASHYVIIDDVILGGTVELLEILVRAIFTGAVAPQLVGDDVVAYGSPLSSWALSGDSYGQWVWTACDAGCTTCDTCTIGPNEIISTPGTFSRRVSFVFTEGADLYVFDPADPSVQSRTIEIVAVRLIDPANPTTYPEAVAELEFRPLWDWGLVYDSAFGSWAWANPSTVPTYATQWHDVVFTLDGEYHMDQYTMLVGSTRTNRLVSIVRAIRTTIILAIDTLIPDPYVVLDDPDILLVLPDFIQWREVGSQLMAWQLNHMTNQFDDIIGEWVWLTPTAVPSIDSNQVWGRNLFQAEFRLRPEFVDLYHISSAADLMRTVYVRVVTVYTPELPMYDNSYAVSAPDLTLGTAFPLMETSVIGSWQWVLPTQNIDVPGITSYPVRFMLDPDVRHNTVVLGESANQYFELIRYSDVRVIRGYIEPGGVGNLNLTIASALSVVAGEFPLAGNPLSNWILTYDDPGAYPPALRGAWSWVNPNQAVAVGWNNYYARFTLTAEGLEFYELRNGGVRVDYIAMPVSVHGRIPFTPTLSVVTPSGQCSCCNEYLNAFGMSTLDGWTFGAVSGGNWAWVNNGGLAPDELSPTVDNRHPWTPTGNAGYRARFTLDSTNPLYMVTSGQIQYTLGDVTITGNFVRYSATVGYMYIRIDVRRGNFGQGAFLTHFEAYRYMPGWGAVANFHPTDNRFMGFEANLPSVPFTSDNYAFIFNLTLTMQWPNDTDSDRDIRARIAWDVNDTWSLFGPKLTVGQTSYRMAYNWDPVWGTNNLVNMNNFTWYVSIDVTRGTVPQLPVSLTLSDWIIETPPNTPVLVGLPADFVGVDRIFIWAPYGTYIPSSFGYADYSAGGLPSGWSYFAMGSHPTDVDRYVLRAIVGQSANFAAPAFPIQTAFSITGLMATEVTAFSMVGWTFGATPPAPVFGLANEYGIFDGRTPILWWAPRVGGNAAPYWPAGGGGEWSEGVPTDAGTYWIRGVFSRTATLNATVSDAVEITIIRHVVSLAPRATTMDLSEFNYLVAELGSVEAALASIDIGFDFIGLGALAMPEVNVAFRPFVPSDWTPRGGALLIQPTMVAADPLHYYYLVNAASDIILTWGSSNFIINIDPMEVFFVLADDFLHIDAIVVANKEHDGTADATVVRARLRFYVAGHRQIIYRNLNDGIIMENATFVDENGNPVTNVGVHTVRGMISLEGGSLTILWGGVLRTMALIGGHFESEARITPRMWAISADRHGDFVRITSVVAPSGIDIDDLPAGYALQFSFDGLNWRSFTSNDFRQFDDGLFRAIPAVATATYRISMRVVDADGYVVTRYASNVVIVEGDVSGFTLPWQAWAGFGTVGLFIVAFFVVRTILSRRR